MKKILYSLFFIGFFSSITAQNPAVEVTKDDQLPYTPQNLTVGDVINYIISVSNTGDVDLTGISLDDPQATLISNFISNLPVGQQVNLTATYVVTQADIDTGYISNSVTASCNYNGQNISDISDDTDPASPSGNDDATITFITQNPDLTLVLDDNLPYTQQLLYQGDDITYTLMLTNSGNVNLQNINITGNNLNITGNITDLAPGDVFTLIGTHTVTQTDINAGIVSAQATAACSFNGNTISDLSDDTDFYSPGGPDDPTLTFLVTPDPDDHDNDGIADNFDIDDDNDGIPDLVEYNGIDPLTDNDGDGVPVYLDDDDNNNSIGNDNLMVESAFDLDGDSVPNHFDLDSDGDGLYDTAESGRLDAALGTDNNSDGILDGPVGNNGLVDDIETSPDSGTVAYNYLDWDGDGTNDFLDTDDDNDNVPSIFEHPDDNSNGYPEDALNTDGDANPNYHDIDDDGDGINTIFEDVALPHIYPQDGNPMNDDTDGDGIPNYLDTDDDNDGIPTIDEHPDDNGNGEPDDALDSNSDGIPNYLDIFNTIIPISITISSNNTNQNLSQGDLLTYEITVENTGNSNQQNIEIYCDNAQIQGNNLLDLQAGQSQTLQAVHQITTADIVNGQVKCEAYGRFAVNGQTLVFRADANPGNSIPHEPEITQLNSSLDYSDYWKSYIAFDYINDMAHTSDANWIAGSVGLVKFDKNTQEFTYFSKSDYNLWAGEIYAVAYEENTGLLWIGTDEGLFIYDGNNITNYQSVNSVFSGNVFDIFIDNNGTKWIGTENGLIKWYNNGNIELLNTSNSNIPFDYIKSITQTEDGAIWLASLHNLAEYRNSNWNFIDAEQDLYAGNIRYIIPYQNDVLIQLQWTTFIYRNNCFLDLNPIPTCGNVPIAISVGVDENQNIWLGLSEGVRSLDANLNPNTNLQLPDISQAVAFISVDANNEKWLNTPMELIEYNNTNLQSFPMESDGLLSNNINCLTIDNNNKPWISIGRSLFDLENDEWQNHYDIYLNTDYENYSFRNIIAHNDTIWGTAWGGHQLIYYENDAFHYDFNSPVQNPGAIYFDLNQNMWMSGWLNNEYCVSKFDGNNWTQYSSSNYNLPDEEVMVFAVDDNNQLWYITFNGKLVQFNNGNPITFDHNNSPLPNDKFRALEIDQNNHIWIGTSNNGLYKFDGTNWTNFNSNNSTLPDNFIFSIKADDNNIWIGTANGGLIKFDNTDFTVYNKENSLLLRNGIYKIEIDTNHNIWIGTQGGGITKFNETGLGTQVNTPNNNPVVSLYPNPAQDYIQISGKDKMLVQKISIYRLSGQLILKKQPENPDDYSIDIHSISKGIYLVKIETDQGTFQRKFIKN